MSSAGSTDATNGFFDAMSASVATSNHRVSEVDLLQMGIGDETDAPADSAAAAVDPFTCPEPGPQVQDDPAEDADPLAELDPLADALSAGSVAAAGALSDLDITQALEDVEREVEAEMQARQRSAASQSLANGETFRGGTGELSYNDAALLLGQRLSAPRARDTDRARATYRKTKTPDTLSTFATAVPGRDTAHAVPEDAEPDTAADVARHHTAGALPREPVYVAAGAQAEPDKRESDTTSPTAQATDATSSTAQGQTPSLSTRTRPKVDSRILSQLDDPLADPLAEAPADSTPPDTSHELPSPPSQTNEATGVADAAQAHSALAASHSPRVAAHAETTSRVAPMLASGEDPAQSAAATDAALMSSGRNVLGYDASETEVLLPDASETVAADAADEAASRPEPAQLNLFSASLVSPSKRGAGDGSGERVDTASLPSAATSKPLSAPSTAQVAGGLAPAASSSSPAMFGGLAMTDPDAEELAKGYSTADEEPSEHQAALSGRPTDGSVALPLPVSTTARLGSCQGELAKRSAGTSECVDDRTSSTADATPSTSSAPDPVRKTLASAASTSGRPPTDALSELLRCKKRHYFIISNSGKPIYSRHGDPEDRQVAAITALIYSLISLSINALGQVPQTIRAGRFALSIRARHVDEPATEHRNMHARFSHMLDMRSGGGHARPVPDLSRVAVIGVIATRAPLPDPVMRLQLDLLHAQFLAWTSRRYERALVSSPSLDTSPTLRGTGDSFELLLKRFSGSLDYVLRAVEMLSVPALSRDAAALALQQAVTDSGALFGVVASGHQLIAIATAANLPQPEHPDPWDLLILLNFVASNPAFRNDLAGQQAWVPLCLPVTAPHSFRHVYIHFPSAHSTLFVVLVASKQDTFFDIHRVRVPLMETLDSAGLVTSVDRAARSPQMGRLSLKDVVLPHELEYVRHMIYHATVLNSPASTYAQTMFNELLAAPRDRKGALEDCLRLHSSMWSAKLVSKSKDPMPVQWRATERWALVGCIEKGEYEAYVVFDPLITKDDACQVVSCIVRHMLAAAELWQHNRGVERPQRLL